MRASDRSCSTWTWRSSSSRAITRSTPRSSSSRPSITTCFGSGPSYRFCKKKEKRPRKIRGRFCLSKILFQALGSFLNEAEVRVLLDDELAGTFRRCFRDPGRDLGDLVVIFRVCVPARDPQHIFHEVHHGGAVLVDERLARRPYDHLRHAERFGLLEQDLSLLAQLRIEGEGQNGRDQVSFLV